MWGWLSANPSPSVLTAGLGPQNSPWLLRVEEGRGQLLPDDAPLRLDPHDGGVLHVLEEQVLVDLGPVHLHCHLHLQHLIRGCGVADDVGWRAPEGREGMELGPWGSRKDSGPGSGPSRPIPARQAPQRQGWHCLGYNDRRLRALSETRPRPWVLSSACVAPFLAIILLN